MLALVNGNRKGLRVSQAVVGVVVVDIVITVCHVHIRKHGALVSLLLNLMLKNRCLWWDSRLLICLVRRWPWIENVIVSQLHTLK